MTYSDGQEYDSNAYDHEEVSALVDRHLPNILLAGAGAITLDPLVGMGGPGPDRVLWESSDELVGYEVGPMLGLRVESRQALAQKDFASALRPEGRGSLWIPRLFKGERPKGGEAREGIGSQC